MNIALRQNNIDIHRILNFDNSMSENTTKVYSYLLNKFDAHIGGNWSQVNKQVIIDYIQELRDRGLQPTSINTTLKALKKFYNMLIDRGHFEHNPVDGVKYETESQVRKTNKHKWLDEATLKRMFHYLKQNETEIGFRNYSLMIFMTFTGLRASEVCSLKFKNIIYRDGKPVEIKLIGKGKAERVVDIDESIIKPIVEYRNQAGLTCSPDDYIFMTTLNNKWRTRKALNRHSLYYIVRSIGEKIGVMSLHPHNLRHTNITHLLKNGCPLHRASEHAGHSSVTITASIYCHDDSPVQPYMDSIKRLIN